jgi:hypothetical protein
VLRRTGPRAYYAAIVAGPLDVLPVPVGSLAIVRRLGSSLEVLASSLLGGTGGPAHLTLSATGCGPTHLTARFESSGGAAVEVRVTDGTPVLQDRGDAGVLATARTLFPSEGPPVLPSLGNVHLLPYGVQEGEAFLQSPPGQVILGEIRERSTVAFREIVVETRERFAVTVPSAIATTGAPVSGGAILRVATDVPAQVRIEVADDARFHRSRVLPAQHTGDFDALLAKLGGRTPGRRIHWRPHLRRKGHDAVGPARSFRVLPRAGSPARVRIAIGACASQFGPIFDHLTETRPDVFVWQGDLNYPDTHGPLSQTVSGYAGIWRDFLANPRMAELLSRTAFAVQRDDHDYGVQDANSTNLVPWGLTPWHSLMEPRTYYRFSAGLAEVWVLDQRLHKSNPRLDDTPAKTLLGMEQRAWLLRTLAASKATFKIVCSPCTLTPPANGRDGSWAAHFTKERDVLLSHIRRHVSGRTIFVSGDTHWTMAYERDDFFEARPCPLGIPTPNDITITSPSAAEDAAKLPGFRYTDDNHGHFALIDVSGAGGGRLELALVRDDGARPYRRTFIAS